MGADLDYDVVSRELQMRFVLLDQTRFCQHLSTAIKQLNRNVFAQLGRFPFYFQIHRISCTLERGHCAFFGGAGRPFRYCVASSLCWR